MANISDYLNTAKKMIQNAIKVIDGQSIDNKDDLQNKTNPTVHDKSVVDKNGNKK